MRRVWRKSSPRGSTTDELRDVPTMDCLLYSCSVFVDGVPCPIPVNKNVHLCSSGNLSWFWWLCINRVLAWYECALVIITTQCIIPLFSFYTVKKQLMYSVIIYRCVSVLTLWFWLLSSLFRTNPWNGMYFKDWQWLFEGCSYGLASFSFLNPTFAQIYELLTSFHAKQLATV